MPMRLANWREARARDFTGIWHDLSRRWAERLAWDSTATWSAVDGQRQNGTLPGLMLLDDERIAAWSFFLIHRNTMQIGALEADSPESTAKLLDGVLSLANPVVAPSGVMVFAFSDAPGLSGALVERGFDVDRYLYLTRGLPPTPSAPPDPDWDRDFAPQLPALFAEAYGEASLTRPFARHGEPDEWREYVAQLIGTGACGRFEARLSSARADASGKLTGAIVTTVVGPGTAHIAQVAVDPAYRGRGMARSMLGDVLAKASRDGLASISLLVSERNAAARRLYEASGFREAASFISAGRTAWRSEAGG
jgi:ribosomal protein S18 acetylase RimI-like enzyme